MEPDKDKPRAHKDKRPARDEYEVAYYTKELGRSLQRRMLQRNLDTLGDNPIQASHGEDFGPQADGSPPRLDRAG